MRSIEQELFSALAASTALMALTTRIFPAAVPETTAATLPAVVYSRAGGRREYSLAGPIGLENAEVAIDVHAASVDSMLAISDAVRSALDAASTAFLAISLSGAQDGYDPETGAYTRSLSVSIWRRE